MLQKKSDARSPVRSVLAPTLPSKGRVFLRSSFALLEVTRLSTTRPLAATPRRPSGCSPPAPAPTPRTNTARGARRTENGERSGAGRGLSADSRATGRLAPIHSAAEAKRPGIGPKGVARRRGWHRFCVPCLGSAKSGDGFLEKRERALGGEKKKKRFSFAGDLDEVLHSSLNHTMFHGIHLVCFSHWMTPLSPSLASVNVLLILRWIGHEFELVSFLFSCDFLSLEMMRDVRFGTSWSLDCLDCMRKNSCCNNYSIRPPTLADSLQ